MGLRRRPRSQRGSGQENDAESPLPTGTICAYNGRPHDNRIEKHSARGSAVKLHDSVERILREKGSVVFSISQDATVYEALEMLEEKNVGALLVMAGDSLVGLLSERDYVRKVKLRGHSSTDLKVEEIMSSPVVTVDPKATVDECMRCMTNKRCRHLPVLDEGKVVGLVSIVDLVNWIMTVQDVTIHQLEDYICGKYPA